MTSQEQIDFIIANAMTMPLKRIAKEINRSSCYVQGEMKRQGIVVPKEIRDGFRRKSQFSKGNTPFNKGKKQIEYMDQETIEKCKATQFKKGRLPHNTKHDYALSLRRHRGGDVYYIRVGLANWEPCHRWIWQQVHGPIPEGHNIQFKDGDTTNFELSNLYMISRKKQAVINHQGASRLPLELQETILLLNDLKKTINEKQDRRPE